MVWTTAIKKVMIDEAFPSTQKVALFTTAAALDADTRVTYGVTNEASGTGYSAGGLAITTRVSKTENTKAVASHDDLDYGVVTIDFQYGEWYDTGAANRSVAVVDYGAQSIAGVNLSFTVPAYTSAAGLARIA